MTGSGRAPTGKSKTPAPDLDDDAQRGARVVALGLLDRVRAERTRLADTEDKSALHDFRVAVRRLRSWLEVRRVLPRRLESRRVRRLLRRLAKATNQSRDDEVFAEWLSAERDTLATRNRAAADWLLSRVTRHRERVERSLSEEVERDLDRAGSLLERQLARYVVSHDVARGSLAVPFATALSGLVRAGTARLRRRLRAVQGPEDDTTIHSARIAAKQVRYQLDAVAAVTPGAKACVTRLKALQDVLGDHHDAHLWMGAVREAIATAPRAAVRQGLEAIAVRAEQRGAERFSKLKADWLTGEPALFTALGALADGLAARGREGMEVERKYLLHRLPPRMPRGTAHRIDQGYVPGERIVERVRRVRTGPRVQYFRTMKAGRGVARIEVEEACSPALFAALWTLTKGRRVRKRRHDVRDGELTWSIDEFTDRKKQLVLAEVELPSSETDVAFPAWLARQVVREVTDEPAFSNLALAR